MLQEILNGMGGATAAVSGGSHALVGADTNAIFFALIYDHLHGAIQHFREGVLVRAGSTVGGIALVVLTIWVFFQGLRIVTGQSRDSMASLVMNSLRATLIVAAAATFGVAGSAVNDFITQDMQNSITHLVTGSDDTTPKALIDDNLVQMQVAMSSIDAIQAINDPQLADRKDKALMMVGFGTAGPAMTGAAMLLLYEVAMAMFVGFGPFFILCLLFDSTKSFFHRWLTYGIGTMFSMAVLAAMVAIATKLVTAVAIHYWATSALAGWIGPQFSSGISTMAMQQGGIGLLLTVLLISTPPMAASFFNGTLGNFSNFSAWTGSQAPAGQRPGESGYRGQSSPPSPSAERHQGAQGTFAGKADAQSQYNSPATNPNYGKQVVQQDQVKVNAGRTQGTGPS